MGILASMFRAESARPGPLDEFWYQPFAPLDGTVPADARTALTVSTVYRGVSVLANTLAMLPLKTMQRDAENNKSVNRSHRLYRPLHDRPNPWQTSFSWRQMGMGHAVLNGNFYNRQIVDRSGRLNLIPLHPERTRVIDQLADMTLLYEHTREDGTKEQLKGGQDILHVHGLSSDGFKGIPVIELMRRNVEFSINIDRFGSSLFTKAPQPRGFLKYPGTMQPDARKAYEDSLARANASPTGWHRIPVLEKGMDWVSAGMNNEDAQFVETKGLLVEDFARYIGVPSVLLMHADKTSTYASAEQFFQAFLTYDIAHWFTAFEQAFERDLLDTREFEADDTFFEFDRTALLRGDAKSRADFYRAMIELGVFTRNEVRALENKNKLDGLDEPLTPMNMQRGQEPPPSGASAQFRQVVTAASERLTKKETTELRKLATKHAGDAEAWQASVLRFYDKLEDEIAAQLAVEPMEASAYVAQRRALVLEHQAQILESFAKVGGKDLADRVLGACDVPSS